MFGRRVTCQDPATGDGTNSPSNHDSLVCIFITLTIILSSFVLIISPFGIFL